MTSGNGDPPAAAVAEVAVRAHKVRGAKHVRDGRPCQDDFAVVGGTDARVLAVADGHGSSAHAEIGARLAVEVATERLLDFARGLAPERRVDLREVHAFAQHPFRVQLVRDWVRRVRDHAGTDDVDLKAYGTTLIFALITPDYVLLGQLGDGDVLAVNSTGTVSRPFPPDPTSFAEETLSLCLPEAHSSLRVLVAPRPAFEALWLVSTDGYSKSYPTDADFDRIGPDYLEMVREIGIDGVAGNLDEFLTEVTTRGSGDDIALAIERRG